MPITTHSSGDTGQAQKIFVFRMGKKYGEEYEEYLNRKLQGRYDLIWIRNPLDSKVALQWNKMFLMNLDYIDPIIVMDIDILLENNFHELFEYPIQRGEFLSIPAWWNERAGYLLNGGFFKYHPKDCKYIFDEFINNSKHWQSHYIKEGITVGPVNGEQYFVEDQVKKHLDLKFVPKSWVTRWTNDSSKNMKISDRWRKKVEDTQLFYHEHNKFNENVKFVHFTTSLNKPHESKLYKY